ncbi:MAG: four-carbon acid sugar kinase family protein [Planctomycetaceae bacterium]|nr:four-carbon acid sugar kinase family protein [Planctomycetaceae bacterium]
MHIGVIADDLTGATDIAGFLANNGLDTIQFMGLPEADLTVDAGAAVVSLKSRSIPAAEAVELSLQALAWLRRNGCKQVYFKYCSTFDSTAAGNIGPVTDALLQALDGDFTVLCPSLPVNGRTVENGVLLVNGTPLSETGMRHHPVNPMTDSNLVTLMEMQSAGKAGIVPLETVRAGAAAVSEKLDALMRDGIRYAALDAVIDADLDVLAEALDTMPLLTGGSGLGGARARYICTRHGVSTGGSDGGRPPGGKVIALSGSCSEMTNKQVARYLATADGLKIDVARCIADPDGYADELAAWADTHAGGKFAPLIYATVGKDELATIQERFGAEATASAVEKLFTILAVKLAQHGFDHFIVAGGETSGAATLALGAKAFRLGPEIAPGVPWIRSLERPLSMALKSGNFGDENFFVVAQEMIG